MCLDSLEKTVSLIPEAHRCYLGTFSALWLYPATESDTGFLCLLDRPIKTENRPLSCDQWFCFMGNHTVSCKKSVRGNSRGDGKKYEQLNYLFKKEQCLNCPHRDLCIGPGKGKGKARKLTVAISAPLFYEKSQEQKQPEFQEKYKKRAAHEWKNAEMKRFHGMARARGWGLRSMTIQAKLTAIAVNLKRIAALVEEKKQAGSCFRSCYFTNWGIATPIHKNRLVICEKSSRA